MIHQEKKLKPSEMIAGVISINETITDLKKRGYQLEFRREATCLYCIELNTWIEPDSFIVDRYYHFEDSLAADRDRILYAISSTQGQKGFLVDTCFVYEDNISPEMMQKLLLEYTVPEEI